MKPQLDSNHPSFGQQAKNKNLELLVSVAKYFFFNERYIINVCWNWCFQEGIDMFIETW